MIRFGTGGWRAVIGDDFIKSNIQKVAAGICRLAKAEGKTDKPVYIGYDRRFLSDTASRWVARCCAPTDCAFCGSAEARRRRWSCLRS